MSRRPSRSPEWNGVDHAVTPERLMAHYEALLRAAGHRGWWPGRTRFEIILGAILTQNTAWRNVEKALHALRVRRLLRVDRLRAIPEEELADLIRPSGYFRQKARKIRAFLDFLDERFDGSLARMASVETQELRRALLSIWGIGPETADSILLYAFRRPIFVVDAYTARVVTRHGLLPIGSGYDRIQEFFAARLPEDVDLFNDFHAQWVWVGHHYCAPAPRCESCPLATLLPSGGPILPIVSATRLRRTQRKPVG